MAQQPINMAHFEAALAKINSSVGKDDIKKHEDWMREFGSS